MHIWDLKYLSTSDEDDGQSSAEESEEQSESKSDKDAIKEDSDEDDSSESSSGASDTEAKPEEKQWVYKRTVREAPELPGNEKGEDSGDAKSDGE